jgi:hypothetical protein
MQRLRHHPVVSLLRVQGRLWREFLEHAGDVQADILLTLVFIVAVGTSWLAARIGGVRFFGWRRGDPAWLSRPPADHGLTWMERQG